MNNLNLLKVSLSLLFGLATGLSAQAWASCTPANCPGVCSGNQCMMVLADAACNGKKDYDPCTKGGVYGECHGGACYGVSPEALVSETSETEGDFTNLSGREKPACPVCVQPADGSPKYCTSGPMENYSRCAKTNYE